VDGRVTARLRGTALAVLAALLTATGHVAGGGALPDLSPMLVLVPMLAAVLVALADRCRGAVAALVALGGGQLLLHELLLVLAHAHGDPPAPGSGMPAGHAVATLVSTVAVRHADDALGRAAAALSRVLPRRLAPPPVGAPILALAVPAVDVPAHATRHLVRSRARRGPPIPC
jgi:hypothetical protein